VFALLKIVRCEVPGSLRLASAGTYGAADLSHTEAAVTDVNGDGRDDLIVEFRIDELHLDSAAIVVDLWGQTPGGAVFTGSDLVEVVQ